MTSDPVAAAAVLIEGIVPVDAVEAHHQNLASSWIASTSDIFRRVKPRTPDPHLVSYAVLVDRQRRRILLGEHRLAGLWLPPGGHVEPGEHPVQTVRREAHEELGIDVEPLDGDTAPCFITWTMTRGPDPHTDVSLWFLLRGDLNQSLRWDRGEFASVQWWSVDELRTAPAHQFDPHQARFLNKLETLAI